MGFDFKFKPEKDQEHNYIALMTFSGAATHEHPAKVLALRTHNTTQLPESVLQVLNDRHVAKCIVGGGSDHSRMQKSFGIGIAGVKDLATVAKEYCI